MSSNRLKLNGDKTQFIWLGTRQQLSKVDRRPLMVSGVQIAPLDMVRNLGVLLDDELTMASHVNSVVRGCFFQLRQLRSVQRSLTCDAKKVIVHAFVASKIDYCNSLLYGTTERCSTSTGFLFDNRFCTRWLSSLSTVSISLPRRISPRCLHPRPTFLDDVT